MKIDPQLIGHPIATVFEVLLIHAGYQVIPTGIEQIIRELRTVEAETYWNLAPERLRLIPDFFVLDVEENKSWMVEVKFRRSVRSTSLLNTLMRMQEEWSPFVLILALGERPKEWKKGEVHHIRAFTIEEETELDEAFLRKSGKKLQDIFLRLKDKTKWKEGTIVKAEDAILRIAEIEE